MQEICREDFSLIAVNRCEVLNAVQNALREKALFQVKSESLGRIVGDIVSLEENYGARVGLWMRKFLSHKVLGLRRLRSVGLAAAGV